MPNEKLQRHLVRLALRQLNGKASARDIVEWINQNYSRTRVGLKKTRYLLRRDAINSKKGSGDIISEGDIFHFKEPKMMLGDVIRLGLQVLGSREILAKELQGSTSRLSEWIKGATRPSEKSLEIVDEFVEKYKLFELMEKK